ncbi:MAG: serine hydrolase [Gemmatimonadaceae bacterium]
MMRRLLSAGLLALSLSAPVHSQPDQRAQLTEKFRTTIGDIARATNGVVGVSIIDLKSGLRFGINDSLIFPQGSAIKIPVLIELYRQADAGILNLDERVALRVTDQVAGSGVSQYFTAGQSMLSMHDLAVLMIVLSDNAATNVLIGKVGMSAVNSTMISMKLPTIRLQRLMIRARESAVGKENVATPAQAAELMRRIHTCELPMAKSRCDELRRVLEIPKSGAFPSSVPSDVRVAWKPGTVEGVETSWGLFGLPGNPYVVTTMVNYSDEISGQAALRQIADAAYQYFLRVARTSAFGVRVPLPLADSVKKPPAMRP